MIDSSSFQVIRMSSSRQVIQFLCILNRQFFVFFRFHFPAIFHGRFKLVREASGISHPTHRFDVLQHAIQFAPQAHTNDDEEHGERTRHHVEDLPTDVQEHQRLLTPRQSLEGKSSLAVGKVVAVVAYDWKRIMVISVQSCVTLCVRCSSRVASGHPSNKSTTSNRASTKQGKAMKKECELLCRVPRQGFRMTGCVKLYFRSFRQRSVDKRAEAHELVWRRLTWVPRLVQSKGLDSELKYWRRTSEGTIARHRTSPVPPCCSNRSTWIPGSLGSQSCDLEHNESIYESYKKCHPRIHPHSTAFNRIQPHSTTFNCIQYQFIKIKKCTSMANK